MKLTMLFLVNNLSEEKLLSEGLTDLTKELVSELFL